MRVLRTTAAALVAWLVGAAAVWAQMGGPAPVYLEPAEVRAIRRTVELAGVAEARRQSTLGAEVAGRVEKMLVQEGDFVKAGGPVCQLRRLPVELGLRKAEGQLAAAQATLKKMEQGFRREEIDQAEARVKAARAGFERWQLEYDRTKKLLADGASTQAEMDTVEAAYRQAREQLAEAEAYQALVRTGNRVEDIESARGQTATAAAAVEELKDTLAKMTITTPFDAFIVRKRTEEGEWLNPGLPVVEVVDLNVVRVLLDVPERYLAGVERGAKAPLVFDALGDREFSSTISEIVPASAAATHTVSVRVDVPNAVENGRPVIVAGLLARVWLPVGEEHPALLVPKSAVIRQMGQDLVYTVSDVPPAAAPGAPAAGAENGGPPGGGGAAVSPDGAPVKFAVAIPIRIIQGYGRFMEVQTEGLKAGTPLVTRGTYLLAAGTPVQVRPKEGAAGAEKPAPKAGIAP